MKGIVLGFILMLVIASCDSDEEILGNDFEIEVDAQYYGTDQIDAWVFFHNTEGELIDQAQFSNGQSLKIQTLKVSEKKITVTLVKVGKNLIGQPYFDLETFLNVNFPTKWKLSESPILAGCGTTKGELDITLQDELVDNINNTSISDLRSIYFPSLSLSSTSAFRFSPLTISDNCAPSIFLYALDKNGNPKYKFSENPQPGAFTYSLNDFSSFDKVIDATFPQNASALLLVKAFDVGKSVHDEGYHINAAYGSYFFDIPISSYKVGYLDKYKKYRTTIHARYYNYLVYNYSLFYDEAGSVPSGISLDNNFTPEVTNSSFSQYKYSANQPIVFKRIRFNYYPPLSSTDSYINWAIFSGDVVAKNPTEVPKTFTQKYPNFFPDKLVLGASLFYTKFNSFDEEVAIKFEGAAKKESFVHFGKELY